MSDNNNNTASRTKEGSIILGSGRCYCDEVNENDYDLRNDSDVKRLVQAIEMEEKQLAYTKGGATFNYSHTWYTAKDDSGDIQKTKMTEDTASLKLGIIATINQSYLKKLFPTVSRSESDENFVINRIGGTNNDDGKVYYFVFINEDPEGDTIIIVKGKNTAALSEQFQAATETSIEIEITGEPLDKDGRKAISVERAHGVEITVPNTADDEEDDDSDEDDEPVSNATDTP